MTAWNPRANELFLAARDLPPDGEREGYLDRACGGDAVLRKEVKDLLDADDRAGSFLEPPSPPPPVGGDGPPAVGSAIGPYTLLRQIGEGGMGTVFLAEQSVPVHRRVALKVIKAGMDSRQVVARFEAERQALA